MSAYHTMDEAAGLLRKSRRWLQGWLVAHPLEHQGLPYYCPMGQAKRFTDNDIARIEDAMREDFARTPRLSRGAQDAVNCLPWLGESNGEIVYFLRAGDTIKIGYSANWKARVAALQTSSPVPLELLCIIPGNKTVEQSLHRRFRKLRRNGEWFQAGLELLAYIADMKAATAQL